MIILPLPGRGGCSGRSLLMIASASAVRGLCSSVGGCGWLDVSDHGWRCIRHGRTTRPTHHHSTATVGPRPRDASGVVTSVARA